jgi:hypothetical protein
LWIERVGRLAAGRASVGIAAHNEHFPARGAFVGLNSDAVALGAFHGLAVMLGVMIAEFGHGHGEFIFA